MAVRKKKLSKPGKDERRLQVLERRIQVLNDSGERYRESYEKAHKRIKELEDHVRVLRSIMATTWQGNDVLRDLLVGGMPMPNGRLYRDHVRDEIMIGSFKIVSVINQSEDVADKGENT